MCSSNLLSVEDIHLRDSDIEAINIYKKEYQLHIDITFKFMFKGVSYLKLKCIDVVNFDLLWNSQYSFYDVSHYKLLIDSNMFYLSLDPYEETAPFSEEDSWTVVCKQMIVQISQHNNFLEYEEYKVSIKTKNLSKLN